MASTVAAASSLASVSSISGAASFNVSNGSRVVSATGTKKATTVKRTTTVRKPAPSGGARLVWFPNAKIPEHLDGSMIGDRGFDPLGLGKPAEYLQFDLDELDQNAAKNRAGDVIGAFKAGKEEVTPTPFQPYNEVFSIVRFRENEVIHGRWAMLAVLGALVVEGVTGVTWQDAGKVELEQGASYWGLNLPFSITALVIIEVLIIGYVEFARNAELNTEKRLYPGGYFDPLGLASDPAKLDTLKLAELKHSRLAMISALGFAVQAAVTGKGPLDNWTTHLADPFNTTIIQNLS
jgi:light-harvesting complex II chlorophyll a/b binding protein 4